MKRIRRYFYGILILLGLQGCGEQVENRYSGMRAYFACKNTNTKPQLHAALGNMGQFATIRLDRSFFIYTDASGASTQENKTSLSNYASFYMGLSGFIVGLPNIPELGLDNSAVVSFDLACPNCYRDFSTTRALQLQEAGYARCSRCNRIYDLNNQGIIRNDEIGLSLYRYRVTYANNTLIIKNP